MKSQGLEFENIDQLLKPVKIEGFLSDFRCVSSWDFSYLKSLNIARSVVSKNFMQDGVIQLLQEKFSDYIDRVIDFDAGLSDTDEPIPYCHDVPLFSMSDRLVDDVRDFPVHIFPKFYQRDWQTYAQFFLGANNSFTPLHFDTLFTHNFYFHIYGRKKFYILPYEDHQYCYRRGWRWFDIDPENLDFVRYPDSECLNFEEIVLMPGDFLYMPPGTLHYVRNLSSTISFNLDIHTPGSLKLAKEASCLGMPMKSKYYNFLLKLALVKGIPREIIFPLYKPYLNYVS